MEQFPVWIALVLSIFNTFILILEKSPRIKVRIFFEKEIDENAPNYYDEFFVVNIINLSSRKIKVDTVWIESKKAFTLFRKWGKTICPELMKVDIDSKHGQKWFWIEPWGNVTLVGNMEEFEFPFVASGRTRVRVAVRDSMGKWYRSNIVIA